MRFCSDKELLDMAVKLQDIHLQQGHGETDLTKLYNELKRDMEEQFADIIPKNQNLN